MVAQPNKSAEAKPLTVVVLSGGTGRTAEMVVRAALAQFHHENVRLIRRVAVREVRAALKIVRQAAKDGAILCHSLVDPKLRHAVLREAQRRMLPTIDAIGPALVALEDFLGHTSRGHPGLYYELNREQLDRIDAVNFTLAHDDGARIEEMDQADVVLVGVSRVAKSVTCFYLAYRGIRAANVPLIVGVPLPPELGLLDAKKVVALSMNAQRLQAIRSARAAQMSSIPVQNYADARKVAEELRYAQQLISEHGWRWLDVSYMAVEEVAKEVVRLMGS